MIGLVLAGKAACREDLSGRPMAGWVSAALAAVPGMERVAVVGPGDWDGALQVEPGDSIVDNLRRGVAALATCGAPAGQDLVVAAGDAPLIGAAAVARFVAACRAAGADFGYPIVSRFACEARFPGVQRTYVRLREGRYTGGNCFYLTPAAVEPAIERLERVFRDRKRPIRLAALLGIGLLLRLVTGRACLAEAERAAGRLLGRRACAIVCDQDAELALDVDKPADLALVRRALSV